MDQRLWKIAWIVMAAGTAIGLLFGIPYGLGFLAGCLVSVVSYKRNEIFWTGVLKTGTSKAGTGLLHFLGNYALMAGVLYAGIRFPQYLNIFTAALGMMLIKIASVIGALYGLARKE